MAEILDGTAETLVVSELIATINGDSRGDVWNHAPGASNFNTRTTPNSKRPDQLGAPWCQPKGNPPCLNVDPGRRDALAAARSFHPGGVNVLMADGSVHFICDSIDAELWKALGSIYGGQPVGGW